MYPHVIALAEVLCSLLPIHLHICTGQARHLSSHAIWFPATKHITKITGYFCTWEDGLFKLALPRGDNIYLHPISKCKCHQESTAYTRLHKQRPSPSPLLSWKIRKRALSMLHSSRTGDYQKIACLVGFQFPMAIAVRETCWHTIPVTV